MVLIFDDIGMLGPRECRGGRDVLYWYMPGLGVAAGSSAIDPFRAGIGVEGTGLALREASDRGGEGGVASVRVVSALSWGGVDAAVGDDIEVVDVAVSETGERGRKESPASRCDVLRWWCLSIVCSANRSFSCTISASILRSESSSRSRWFSILSASRSCSPILISSSRMTVRSIATLYFDSISSSDEVWLRVCRSKSSFWTSISRSLCCNDRCESRRAVISFWRIFCALLASVLLCLYFV